MTTDKELFFQCPNCGTRITNTARQSAVLNFQCAGVVQYMIEKFECINRFSDYVLVEEKSASEIGKAA